MPSDMLRPERLPAAQARLVLQTFVPIRERVFTTVLQVTSSGLAISILA